MRHDRAQPGQSDIEAALAASIGEGKDHSLEEAMAVVILAIVVAWVIFSAFLVTVVCMNSSRLSQLEETPKPRRARPTSRAKKMAPQVQAAPLPAGPEHF